MNAYFKRSASLFRDMFALGCIAIAVIVPTKAAAKNYTLGAQDKVKIRVFEWRPVTASNFEWTPLTGEFVVSASGTLSLPIIGSLVAIGLTPDDLATAIGERLQKEIGLQKRPSASVEISEYRPIFITGVVSRPGKFAYSPDLTVIQALSMAGGASGPVDGDVLSVQREALSRQGELRELDAERVSLEARRARLEAVVDNRGEIAFPPEVTQRASEFAVDEIMRAEQTQFAASQRTLRAETDALGLSRQFAGNQIEALQAKAASLKRQVELATKELNNVKKLVTDGLSVSARQIGASQNLSELESRSLDVSLAILTAQQDLVRIEREVANVRDRYQIEALGQAADVRDKLAANAEKVATAQAMLENLQLNAPQVMAQFDIQRPVLLSVDRMVDGSMRRFVVAESDPVLPGDVIRVERPRESRPVAGARQLGGGTQ